MLVYFDQNIWRHLADNVQPSALESALADAGMRPALGTLNIYEFGRCFLKRSSSRTEAAGRGAFRFLAQLREAAILKQTSTLVEADLTYAMTGGRLLTVLTRYEAVAAREEMHRLALGFCDRAVRFIGPKERNSLTAATLYRKRVLAKNPTFKRPREFALFRDDWGHRRGLLEASEFRSKALDLSDSALFANQKKYPFLNTFISAQLHLLYLALSSKDGPSRRRIPDYRHLIDANCAAHVVSNDVGFLKAAARLSPFQLVRTWEEFRQSAASLRGLPPLQGHP